MNNDLASQPRPFVDYPTARKQYAPTLPSLTNGQEAQPHPVVIVGAGPVGLTLALGLALRGVRVVVLEVDDGVCTGSRAICFSRRSLEIFERLGVLNEVRELGLPWTGGRSYFRETEVLHFQMPHDATQKLPPMVNLSQIDLESILVERTRAFPGLIEIRWQSELTGLERHADFTTLRVHTPLGDYACGAQWLVACDGARSRVREALGLRMQGTRYEGQYIIVDIALKSSRPTERLAYFDPSCNRGSTVLVHKQPNDIWRIDYQLREGEDPNEAVKPEAVLPRVQRLLDMMGETAHWSPIWISLYRASALTLDAYVHQRVIFAGDAAHLLPIFGVRGANSGIDDADNLAWKLAWVARGFAHAPLLESYSQERVAAARENMRLAMKSTEFMAPPSFAFELLRTACLSLARDVPRLRSLINPRQTAALEYADSPLNALARLGDAGAAGPRAGTPLVECPLMIEGRAGHITDLLRGEALLLWFSNLPSVESENEATLTSPQRPVRRVQICGPKSDAVASVRDVTGEAFARYGIESTGLYLVRPDGYVWGRWLGIARDEAIALAVNHFNIVTCLA